MSVSKKDVLWAYIRSKESQATNCWLPEMESTVENILKHYEGNTTIPWIFNLQSFTNTLLDGKYHYIHLLRTYLKKDRRLRYLIKQPGNQEIFCPANYCVHSVDDRLTPIASENKIEVSDGNAAYIHYMFHLAIWLTHFEVNRLKLIRNRAFCEVNEILCLLQKPFFKTELDIQPYTIDKVFYDVVGLMSSMGKLSVEILKPSNERIFRLSAGYISHLCATKPLARIFEVTGVMLVEDDEVAGSWRRYITPHLVCILKSGDNNERKNDRDVNQCAVEKSDKENSVVASINEENSHSNKQVEGTGGSGGKVCTDGLFDRVGSKRVMVDSPNAQKRSITVRR